MDALRLALPEVILLTPKVFGDDRGFFYESFNEQVFAQVTGVQCNFVQDNHSRSQRGVLRGLHYQLAPRAQGKLVRVVHGEVLDVAVDLRKSSPNFGRWVSAHLSAENKEQLWIPEGFGHGFVTLSESAEFLYKTTDYYSPAHERCIAWNDPAIGIDWTLSGEPVLSGKDRQGACLASAEVFA